MRAAARYLRAQLPAEPGAVRYAAAGAIVAGGIGAIAGLILGLDVYPPTAWFAVVELGVPAAILGGVAGVLAVVVNRVSRDRRRRSG